VADFLHGTLCAGGTTACVAAGRLAAHDASLKILILEAGEHTLDQAAHVQPYQYITHHVPTSTMLIPNVGNPGPRLNGRAPIVHCGHCVGGGSNVNCLSRSDSCGKDHGSDVIQSWYTLVRLPRISMTGGGLMVGNLRI
jgi:alcohol oxidase